MISRRKLLRAGVGAVAAGGASLWLPKSQAVHCHKKHAPAFSITPVVGDGKWIWNEPPKDETGYLEPRPYDVEIGMQFEGVGNGSKFMSTTPVPVEYPEQKIDDVKVEAKGCEAKLRKLADGAAQLVVRGSLGKGQQAQAIARYQITLHKQYHGYNKEQFPEKQEVPNEVRGGYLQDSPGIQTRIPAVRKLSAELSRSHTHPWDKAQAFAGWIRKNIRPQIGSYTSVAKALTDRRGDCEEMAAVFVALCRAVAIPARLVWVPNHNWSEFFLADSDGKGCWIPVHTASYFWFGWTGAHELVLQKGDRVDIPDRRGKERLLTDYIRYTGRQPKTRYIGRLAPKPATEGTDAGPGARNKDERGQWKVVGKHELDRYMRQ